MFLNISYSTFLLIYHIMSFTNFCTKTLKSNSYTHVVVQCTPNK